MIPQTILMIFQDVDVDVDVDVVAHYRVLYGRYIHGIFRYRWLNLVANPGSTGSTGSTVESMDYASIAQIAR